MLNAKSIGWLPTKAHFADVKEATKNNRHEGMLIVEEWLLFEFAVSTSASRANLIFHELWLSVSSTLHRSAKIEVSITEEIQCRIESARH